MEEKIYSIYLLTFPDGAVYIGSTCQEFERRMYQHKCDAWNEKRHTYNFNIYKHWRENLDRGMSPKQEVLRCEKATYAKAHELEKEYTIAYFNMNYNVLNEDFGDSLGESHKIKISESLKGKRGGVNSYWYGKCMSEETKIKLSEAMKGRFAGEKNYFYGIRRYGQDNNKSHPKQWYENNSVVRHSFKRTCKCMGWNFDDFEEIFADWYIKPDGRREKKYFYFEKQNEVV